MITTKLFEEFQSCLEKSIQEIKEPKNDYEKLLLEFNGFLKNELICVQLDECEIQTNEIISIFYADEDEESDFYLEYHHEYNEIMAIDKSDNSGSYYLRKNPAYEEIRENIYRLKQS